MILNRMEQARIRASRGFTLLEIAVCLGVIGFAIVAVLGVLPTGLNVQRDTRERTVVLQDARYFMETLRRGATGTNDLAQYVAYVWGVSANGGSFQVESNYFGNDADVVRLMSRPKVSLDALAMERYWGNSPRLALGSTDRNFLHTVALVRSLAGPASEKGPNADPDRLAFYYLLKVEVAQVTSIAPNSIITENTRQQGQSYTIDQRETKETGQTLYHLEQDLYEVRVTAMWPAVPGDYTPAYKPTAAPRNQVAIRTFVSGQLNIATNLAGAREFVFKPQRFL